MQGLKVSIGIPTYNRSEYLIRAVESAIAQSYPNIEIIVSDNCSTDDTAKRVSDIHDPRVKFLQQTQNLGMTGNFNACLHAATGDLFLMLSDDDLLYRDAVERLSEPLRREPSRLQSNWPCVVSSKHPERHRRAYVRNRSRPLYRTRD